MGSYKKAEFKLLLSQTPEEFQRLEAAFKLLLSQTQEELRRLEEENTMLRKRLAETEELLSKYEMKGVTDE